MSADAATRMPVAFLGHGTPLNALMANRWTSYWSRASEDFGNPRAILAISAHWCTAGTGVTAMEAPPTIHDFGGFPHPLFEIQYPAPGSPELARRVQDLLQPTGVILTDQWGLDHGTWSVLSKIYPAANIPVVQVSMDMRYGAPYHFELGRKLAPLRSEGVLILGTGNIVHNLEMRVRNADFAYDWATRFNDAIRSAILAKKLETLIKYEALGEDAALAVPTPDHYFPLLYVAGAAGDDDPKIGIDGIEGGSMSMLSVVYRGS